MKKYIEKYKELLTYLIVGVITTLLNLLVFYLLDTVLGFHYLYANLVSILIAMVFAFFMNKWFVFKIRESSKRETAKEFFLFISFRSISASIDMLTMGLLVGVFLMNSNLAKLITEIIIAAMNYFFSKFVIFKKVKK